MSRTYQHHKYTWSKPFLSVRHNWECVGPQLAVQFHASLSDRHEPACGLEFHRFTPTDGNRTAPSQLNCPLTGGRCWHDGTSLYASETLWPSIEFHLRKGDHDAIFRILEREADDRADSVYGHIEEPTHD